MQDTVLGAIQLTVIDIVMVFIVLVFLALVIKAVESAVGRGASVPEDQPDLLAPEIDTEPARLESIEPETIEPWFDPGVSPAIVAAISAAISAYAPDSVPFVITSVSSPSRAAQDAWVQAGRRRLMAGRDIQARRRHKS